MVQAGQDPDALVRSILGQIGDKWSVRLLSELNEGPLRHAVLKRRINAGSMDGHISQRMMTRALRAMERDGFVWRTVTGYRCLRVDYGLTPFGQELLERLNLVITWLIAQEPTVLTNRALFDARDDDWASPKPAPEHGRTPSEHPINPIR